MQFFYFLIFILFLPSCSHISEGNKISRYNIELANAYMDKASQFSYSHNGGWNSLRMQDKSLEAASGYNVLPYIADPEFVGSVTFAEKLNAKRDLFANLLEAYPIDTKIDNPRLTARTQASLDCWILGNSHEVELAFNNGICKREFFYGLQQLLKITKNHMKFRDFSDEINSIFFKFNSYHLTEDAIYRLNKVLKEINKVQNATLMLYGYTDDVGSPKYNQILSKRRIEIIKKFLIDSGVIAKNKIEIKEIILGEFDPLASQNTINNNPYSRRVDIFVMR